MNEERIKAFARIADIHAYSISDADPSVNWYKVRDEKFAEMLVRECADLADLADLADVHKCQWIGGNILTYFGLKYERTS